MKNRLKIQRLLKAPCLYLNLHKKLTLFPISGGKFAALLLSLGLIAFESLFAGERQLIFDFNQPCPLAILSLTPANVAGLNAAQFIAWVERCKEDKTELAFKVYSPAEGGEIWVRGIITELTLEGSKREGFNVRNFVLDEPTNKNGKPGIRKRLVYIERMRKNTVISYDYQK